MTFLPKPRIPKPTQLVMFVDDNWSFVDYNTLKLQTSKYNTRYVRMKTTFAIADETSTDPNEILVTGIPGDYLFIDKDGLLSIVANSLYHYYV